MVTMVGSATETQAGLMRLAADGDEIAFASLVDGHHPDWSPDASRLLFLRQGSIYLMSADGSGQAALTTSTTAGVVSGRASWSR